VVQSTERYNASLAIQESDSLRGERDTRILTLGADIKRRENESVVREVRDLVNNARSSYFGGDFERAEELLVRARNRWLVTNFEEDSELNYWLTVVRGALSLRSGRVIPVTAPLYAEMSQLLSDARKRYDEGVRHFNNHRRTEGLATFAEARRKTREVKLMFPVNQEAGLLELKMDQITDPGAFNESFTRRFNEAVAGTKSNRRSVEAFADLQNLAEINPRYPGIALALAQAEIDMGYKLPPPDPRTLARAQELTREAREIINARIRSEYPIALEQLNQALQLDPNNTQAMYEKDRVQTLLGAEGNIVLDSAAEQEYQRAVREFQQQNKLMAISIVRQLLQNPQNRNSARILELQRRIESAL
jgi:tetratricopeptide (TPR) repeat protein